MENELRGDASVLEKWVDYGKKHDNRHLYAGSANLEAMGRYLPLQGDQFQVAHAVKVDGKRFERRMGSYFNTECPNTAKDYSYTLVTPIINVRSLHMSLANGKYIRIFGDRKIYRSFIS